MKTIVGLYEDITDAQNAINDLVRSGFDRADISLVASNQWADETESWTTTEAGTDAVTDPNRLGEDVAAGMATGGVVGGLGGVLLGLGALAIPGIGPIVAAGPLVAGLTGAGIGAAVGLVTLAQLLSWLFKRYHDLTVAILIGFMVGSLRKVWPWKEILSTTIDRHGVEVPLVVKNVLPAFGTEMLVALAFALIGFAAVVVIERLAAD